ncbi:hypothetical protein M2407_005117 [Serratia sp. BIGb0234]|uniref:hypothetical protein n=1 Tax=Serratia sp. BIGb0234 TaxID=2940614 RepID=UPI0021681090|nr:hypothetical protein [Serratia sp. BIGb0234]MCS4320743.1 hypothetical protein [Serratia sp. BIGb0234]
MRAETEARVKAFRRALRLARDTPEECGKLARWYPDVQGFPGGCCELASHFLAKYLKDHDDTLCPYLLQLDASETFRKATGSTVHGHVIVALNGDYIDLTLDQFDEYENYVTDEPIGSDAPVDQLLAGIRRYAEEEGAIRTRDINLSGGEALYEWLRNTANRRAPTTACPCTSVALSSSRPSAGRCSPSCAACCARQDGDRTRSYQGRHVSPRCTAICDRRSNAILSDLPYS